MAALEGGWEMQPKHVVCRRSRRSEEVPETSVLEALDLGR